MGIRSSCIKGVAVSVAVVFGVSLASAAGAKDPSSIITPTAAARQDAMTALPLQTAIEPGPDKQVVSLFTGPGRKLVQITLPSGRGAGAPAHLGGWPGGHGPAPPVGGWDDAVGV